MKKYPFLHGEIRPIQGGRNRPGRSGGTQARDAAQTAPKWLQLHFQGCFSGAGYEDLRCADGEYLLYDFLGWCRVD
jgi:hypothetical protein